MSDTLLARVDQLRQKFSALPNWEDRYKFLIEMGRELPELPEQYRKEENIVRGCQSQVWLHANLDEHGKIQLQADSDAMIVKGLIAVLMKVYSDSSPSEIMNFPPEFLKEFGFEGNLSPSRSNGLHSMLKQIRNYAVAFDYFLKSKKTN